MFPRPNNPAQQKRTEVCPIEIRVLMPGNAYKRPVRVALISPDLRLDIVHGHLLSTRSRSLRQLRLSSVRSSRLGCVGARKHMNVGRQIHVVIDLVLHFKVRAILGDRIEAVGEIKIHRPLKPLRRSFRPRPTNQLFVILGPLRRIGHRPRMNHHNAAAPLREGIQTNTFSHRKIPSAISMD